MKNSLNEVDALEGEGLPEEVSHVLNDLPEDKRALIINALMVEKSHSGPLPSPETLRVYNEVIPNGGDRLMSTVEKQLNHRIDIEKKGVTRSFNQSSTGQWMGFLIAMFFCYVAWDLAKNGQELVASILGAIDIIALVAIFITGRKKD